MNKIENAILEGKAVNHRVPHPNAIGHIPSYSKKSLGADYEEINSKRIAKIKYTYYKKQLGFLNKEFCIKVHSNISSSPEILTKMSESGKRRWENISEIDRKLIGDKIRIKTTLWWKNLTRKEKSDHLRKMFTRIEPSTPEQNFIDICNKFNLQYVYTGHIKNKAIDINGKVPDFLHTSKNIIVEIYGEYFHKNHDPNERIRFFNGLGYDCLVIWANDLKNENLVASRILEFEKCQMK